MSLQQLREKIVSEIPISDLIERYGVHLVHKGNRITTICPFHDDTNPSMHVNNDYGNYKCFACGAGGSHFDFVMNLHTLEFVDALRDICEKFGINFDAYTSKRNKPKKEIFAEKILKVASAIYYKYGQDTKPAAYLDFLKNRNMKEELAELYQIGFAPKQNSIYDYIHTLPEEDREEILKTAIEIGIVKYNPENKSHYDTYRERVMFPIWDHYGRVIGFTGRRIRDEQYGKYVNSKGSFIFNKSNLLYGLHLAKSYIRKRDSVIIVEGNMDQVATFKKGFENSVAIMGTALGDNSLRVLKALTKNIYLALDNDEAGYKAAQRTSQQFLEYGILAKYVNLAPHKDPDDFLEAEGIIAFQERIDNAPAFIDYELDQLIPQRPIELIDEKLSILDQAFEVVAPLKNDINATERLLALAPKLKLNSSNEQINTRYENFLKGVKKPAAKPVQKEVIQEDFNMPEYDESYMASFVESDANQMPTIEEIAPQISKTEETLLLSIIEHPECLEYDEMTDLLDFMQSDGVKEYILNLRKLIFEIDEREFKNFALSSSSKYGLEEIIKKGIIKNKGIQLEKEKAVKIISDLAKILKQQSFKDEKKSLRQKMSSVKTEDELKEIMKQIHDIEKKLLALK